MSSMSMAASPTDPVRARRFAPRSVKEGAVLPSAAWTYEAPYTAVSAIRDYLAFYPDRVDAIEVGVED